MSIASQASEAAQVPKLLMYGGSAFSIGQWFAENANEIAAGVGIIVTIVGLVWNRIDARQRNQREIQEHQIRMEVLRKELAEK